jgi:hypothetical protein
MTEELTLRAERAIADLEAVAAFVRGTFFQAQMEAAVRMAVIEGQSPWLDRNAAAARWRCSVDEIDRAAKAGVLVRHERGNTPLFDKAQGMKRCARESGNCGDRRRRAEGRGRRNWRLNFTVNQQNTGPL